MDDDTPATAIDKAATSIILLAEITCTTAPITMKKAQATPDPRVPSPFLALPAELRNTIYGYVFEQVGGGITASELGNNVWHPSDNVRPVQEINQLRRVCRQLREETTNMVVLCNDVHFSSFERIIAFLDAYPAQHYEDLQTLHVFQAHALYIPHQRQGLRYQGPFYSIEEVAAMRELASRCRQHSSLKVHVHLGSLSTGINSFFYMALMEAAQVNRTQDLLQAMATIAPLSSDLLRFASDLNDTVMVEYPLNVTFFTWDRTYDIDRFQATLQKTGGDSLPCYSFSLNSENFDWWTSVVKHVAENGF